MPPRKKNSERFLPTDICGKCKKLACKGGRGHIRIPISKEEAISEDKKRTKLLKMQRYILAERVINESRGSSEEI
jgi:hypothetical protein